MIIKVRSGDLIEIGKKGEHYAVRVVFDIAEYFKEFGAGGEFFLLNRRSIEEEPYPVTVALNGLFAEWTVTYKDTAYDGRGECELQYHVGGRCVKSEVWQTRVRKSVGEVEAAPDWAAEWKETLLAAKAQVEQTAERAESMAEEADRRSRRADTTATGAAALAQNADRNAGDAKEKADEVYGAYQRGELKGGISVLYKDNRLYLGGGSITMDGRVCRLRID